VPKVFTLNTGLNAALPYRVILEQGIRERFFDTFSPEEAADLIIILNSILFGAWLREAYMEALRRSFASCLDERVFVYKHIYRCL